jgi:hypothetical protein
MITKQLKNFLWEFDEDTKELIVTFQPYGVHDANSFSIPKTQMVSLERFIIRVMAKLSTKRRIKNEKLNK